jgi:hypothetical protein
MRRGVNLRGEKPVIPMMIDFALKSQALTVMGGRANELGEFTPFLVAQWRQAFKSECAG